MRAQTGDWEGQRQKHSRGVKKKKKMRRRPATTVSAKYDTHQLPWTSSTASIHAVYRWRESFFHSALQCNRRERGDTPFSSTTPSFTHLKTRDALLSLSLPLSSRIHIKKKSKINGTGWDHLVTSPPSTNPYRPALKTRPHPRATNHVRATPRAKSNPPLLYDTPEGKREW